MNNYKNKIAITTGDPNGIGAEIVIKSINKLNLSPKDFVIISNDKVLETNNYNRKDIEIINLPYDSEINTGKDSAASGDFSFRQLETACKLQPKRIVTAPVSKNAMHLAGHFYNGQTEVLEHFLAKNGEKAEMLFICNDFRILLLTRHIAIKDIKITKKMLITKIKCLQNFFKNYTKIKTPKFGLCGLNPHCGENGVIGNEELEIIKPAIKELRNSKINISDPVSADIILSNALLKALSQEKQPYDCYIAMYHDQGLIPMKAAGRNNVVNTTIGLPIIRTSPAHGTAYDIAGKGIADEGSMIAAIKEAINL